MICFSISVTADGLVSCLFYAANFNVRGMIPQRVYPMISKLHPIVKQSLDIRYELLQCQNMKGLVDSDSLPSMSECNNDKTDDQINDCPVQSMSYKIIFRSCIRVIVDGGAKSAEKSNTSGTLFLEFGYLLTGPLTFMSWN